MEPVSRVATALERLGARGRPRQFDRSTATAAEAAAAVGCELGQIVKTLLFFADGRPTLVLVAGDRRVDPSALARILGVRRKRLRMASPAEVLEHTSFAVGGLPPVGHTGPYDVVLDASLQRFDTLWAAAGTADTVFETTPDELARITSGQWAEITKQC